MTSLLFCFCQTAARRQGRVNEKQNHPAQTTISHPAHASYFINGLAIMPRLGNRM
jgi:hypothetical protein